MLTLRVRSVHNLRGILKKVGGLLPSPDYDVTFVVEPKNWSIAADGSNIAKGIVGVDSQFRLKVTKRPYLASSRVVHFGSQFMFQNWLPFFPSNQKIIVTYFHGNVGENSSIDSNLNFIRDNQGNVSRVIVSIELMRRRLINLGVAPSLITRIPIGVATSVFTPPSSPYSVHQIRKNLDLPAGYKIVGSFQKDGEGWGEGLSPKLIKGPDILIEALRAISKNLPTFVLLSGPSRGYVVKELERFGIPFKHVFAKSDQEMADLYRALDLYIVSSREEGGPKGLLEALSVGCPVVTTPVGMATDMISTSNNFSILKNFDFNSIAEESIRVLCDSTHVKDRENLRRHVLPFDWKEVSISHLEDVYRPLTLGVEQS